MASTKWMAFWAKQVQRFFGRRLATTDGFARPDVVAAEARLGFRLPEALRCFYLAVGRVDEFTADCRVMVFLPELEIEDGFLIVSNDQQFVASFAIPETRLTDADPVIWERINTDAEDDEWNPTDETFTQFMVANFEFSDEAGLFDPEDADPDSEDA